MRNPLQGISRLAAQAENAPHDFRLGLIDRQTRAAILSLDRCVSEASPARVKAAKGKPLHSPMRLLSQFAPVHRVNQSVNANQQFRLRAVGVNSLGYSYYPHAGEFQALV